MVGGLIILKDGLCGRIIDVIDIFVLVLLDSGSKVKVLKMDVYKSSWGKYIEEERDSGWFR